MKAGTYLRPLLCSLLITGCSLLFPPPTKPSLWRLKPAIETEVKIGMHVDDAKEKMEALGFRCTLEKGATLQYYANTRDITMTKIEDVDFLDCTISEQDGCIRESLSVSLLTNEDFVKEIYYVQDLTGP